MQSQTETVSSFDADADDLDHDDADTDDGHGDVHDVVDDDYVVC